MSTEQTKISESLELLHDALDHIENWPKLTDLTQDECQLHNKHAAKLRSAVSYILELAKEHANAEDAILNITQLIYSAHITGTFKTPPTPRSQQEDGKSIFHALLQATTKRPTAEFVSRLQEFDPDFRRAILAERASKMRDARAMRNHEHERALMEAIRAEITQVPCEHPSKEAEAIQKAVNLRLTAAGSKAVSVDVIRRRIEKQLRS